MAGESIMLKENADALEILTFRWQLEEDIEKKREIWQHISSIFVIDELQGFPEEDRNFLD